MGLIDIINPLSAVLGSAVNESQQHQEKNYWESRKSSLGEKQVCYLCALQLTPHCTFIFAVLDRLQLVLVVLSS